MHSEQRYLMSLSQLHIPVSHDTGERRYRAASARLAPGMRHCSSVVHTYRVMPCRLSVCADNTRRGRSYTLGDHSAGLEGVEAAAQARVFVDEARASLWPAHAARE